MMKIKNLILKNNIFLAPMAGVTDIAYRTIAKEMGCGLVVGEMISDKGLLYDNKKTLEMINIDSTERPMALQLFGSDEKSLLEASRLVIDKVHPEMIDLNMGCPMKKIVQNGSGSALLKNPDKIYTIVKTLTDNLDIPISCKIRIGWDHNSINCDKVSQIIEKAGASLITVHGRCRSDFYEGVANLDYIKLVKESVSIPVVGNGDIIDLESCDRMFNFTGCDAVAVGRGALGNPWIFKELVSYYEEKKIIDKSKKEEILQMILEHALRLIKIKNERSALIQMRTHGAWYLKQLIGTKPYRIRITQISTLNELKILINEIMLDNKVYVR